MITEAVIVLALLVGYLGFRLAGLLTKVDNLVNRVETLEEWGDFIDETFHQMESQYTLTMEKNNDRD